MRRDDICLFVSPANRARLGAIVKDRNSTRKAVWRARIVLATADGCGTNEIMRRTGKSQNPPFLIRLKDADGEHLREFAMQAMSGGLGSRT